MVTWCCCQAQDRRSQQDRARRMLNSPGTRNQACMAKDLCRQTHTCSQPDTENRSSNSKPTMSLQGRAWDSQDQMRGNRNLLDTRNKSRKLQLHTIRVDKFVDPDPCADKHCPLDMYRMQ